MAVPKITVLMAVYNGEAYLKRTIQSILNQTFRDFELLIINDCSTDRTLDVIDSYKDERIVVHTNEENMGQINSLNKGLSLARGEYVARLDADDVALGARLEKQYAFLKINPSYAAVGSAGMMVGSDYKRIGLVFRPTTYEGVLERMFYATPLIHVSTTMNRDIVLKHNGYDPRYPLCADYDLWLRMVSNKHKLISLPDVLVQYVVDKNSLGNKEKATKNIEENAAIVKSGIERMIGLAVTLEETRRLSKYLLLGPHFIDEKDRLAAEVLIKQVAAALNERYALKLSDKKVNRLMSKCYLKSALHYLENDNKEKARELLLASMSKNGLSFYSGLLFILSCLDKRTIKITMNHRDKARRLHDSIMRLLTN